MPSILQTAPDAALASETDPGLYQALYERALIGLWPHLSFDQIPKRILDLGCGQGTVADLLSTTFERAHVIGLGTEASGMNRARSLRGRANWIEAPNEDWLRLAHQEGPFDLILSHNGWPLEWTLESGLERLIETVAPGGEILLHLDLSLYAAVVPAFGVYAELADAYSRLGHLASGERLDIWRCDYALSVRDGRALTGLLAAMTGFGDATTQPVEALGKLKSQVTPEGRLISRHLFLKLRI